MAADVKAFWGYKMTTSGFVLWGICIGIVWMACAAVSAGFLRKNNRTSTACILAVSEAALAVIAALFTVVFSNSITWHLNKVIAAIYIVLSGYCVSNLIALLICSVAGKDKLLKIKTVVSFAVTLLFAVYGTLNMQAVTCDEHMYSSDKLKEDHRFAAVSDVHFGSPQSPETVEKMLKDIEREEPDFLLLAGDITDERTEKNEMRNFFRMVGDLDIPTYYIYGNHDRQGNCRYCGGRTYTDKELCSAIRSNGIRILKDEVVNIGSDISLLGREDLEEKTRKPVEELPKREKNRYQITADHEQCAKDDILKTGADLQISGHSHAGQLFPLQFLYDIGGFEAHGEYYHGKTLLYVSSGAAGWYVPFRSSSQCHYEVFDLLKK